MPPNDHTSRVLKLVREAGILRPRDLDSHQIPRDYLKALHRRGLLERIGRGLYVLPETEPTEFQTLAEACKLVPRGVICLLSALQFHGLTTQAPFEVWMAIGEKDWKPTTDYPPLRILRFSGDALTFGVQETTIQNVPARVYSPAKTVADCFKYRNKIGLDVAIEALRDTWRQKRATMDELLEAAKVCRVARIMRPYLESVT